MYTINYIDLAGSVFYHRLRKKIFNTYVSYQSLHKYGDRIVAILKEKGIDARIDPSRDTTNVELDRTRVLFEEYNYGIRTKKVLQDIAEDLLHCFVLFPCEVVEAFGDEGALTLILKE